MDRFKFIQLGLLLALLLFVGSCNQQPKQYQKEIQPPAKSVQVNPETELIANEYLELIQEKINGENNPVVKIQLIKELVSDWGCMDRNAQNYDRFAKYDCCCTYTASQPPDE